MRRFHAFNVGIPKTGTGSIAAICRGYRAGHEFLFEETVTQIRRWRSNEVSPDQFRLFLRQRDDTGQLEMDSSSFNHFYLAVLLEEFPEARFVLTIRDCYSWLNSFWSMLIRWRGSYGLRSDEIPAWQLAYGELMFPNFDAEAFLGRTRLRIQTTSLLDSYLRFWADSNEETLRLLPPDRTLIIRTGDISQSIDRLALFLAVPQTSMRSADSHSNPGPLRCNLFAGLDLDQIEEGCERHCAPLMTRFFPGYGLSDFMNANFTATE